MTIPLKNYEPDVPRAKDKFNETQEQIQQNFQTLYNAFSKNHGALDALSGAGNHTYIEMPGQTSSFQTNTSEISVYSRKVEGQTEQIFMRYQGNQDEIRVSNYQIYPIDPIMNGTKLVQSTFISFLPGNLIVYFGFIQNPDLQLIFNPAICRHIISANFCFANVTDSGFPAGSSGTPPNVVVTQLEPSKIITKMAVQRFPYYYLIFGNT